MFKEIKSAFSWMWKRIKKHPRLAIFSTIALAATAYFVLPIVGITALSVGITVATCAVAGPVLGGFLGWVGQKIGLIKPDPIPQKFEKFQQSSPALQHMIGRNFLDHKTSTSKDSKTLFAAAKFLQHVTRGEQDEAEAMLREEAKHSAAKDSKEEKHAHLSELLTTRGTVTDLSGRTFTDITALRYAFWAKDRHMWQMLLKYLPAEKALEQYEEHQKQGASYEMEGKTIRNEHHYNFSPLKIALQQYVDYINSERTPAFNSDEADRLWLEVGKAQRYVPAHVAHEYCREDRSFDPLPTFAELTLPRTLRFYNWITRNISLWFSAGGLGDLFAIYRGALWRCGAGMPVEDRPGLLTCDTIRCGARDLAAVTALDKVRTQEYDNLPKSLNAQPHPADDQPKVGNAAAILESPRRRSS